MGGTVKQIGRLLVVLALLALTAPRGAAQQNTLDIYFIDVEGGQSTLVVTPAGESLLIDTGFPSDGTFASVPGDPRKARDANRIAAAARAAGVKQIDYLLITHFHADHDGAVPELAQLLPIRTFVDHDSPAPDAEARVPGTQAAFEAYARVRAKGKHLAPKPGDRIPLTGVETIVVSAAGATLKEPLAGAGGANLACGATAPAAQEPTENPRSTGVRLRFGRFTFLDPGDLSGQPLFALVCPANLVGPTDLYLVAHHGGADAGDAASFAGIAPRVAILNNGTKKGGAPEVLAALHQARGLEDAWQLHRSLPPGPRFFNDDRIANLDESTAYWLKVSAKTDGSFIVTNGRTGAAKAYGARSVTSRPPPRALP
jgi:beta-lactamase superfamily II metal-dependent hydrolase